MEFSDLWNIQFKKTSQVDGRDPNTKVCPECKGSGRCITCSGDGQVDHAPCKGEGCGRCVDGVINCPRCVTKESADCICRGSGCRRCGGMPGACPNCSGAGEV